MDRTGDPTARQLETIAASDVSRYVDATGDANPLWLDNDFARSAGYRGRFLPPMLVGWVPFSLKEGTERADIRSDDLRRRYPSGRLHQRAQRRLRNRVAGSRFTWASNSRPADQDRRHRRAPRQSGLGHLHLARRNKCSTPTRRDRAAAALDDGCLSGEAVRRHAGG